MQHAGFSTEKSLAARALTDGRATLFTINRDNYLDGRNVQINFRSDMPEAVDRILGGVLAEDWPSVGPWIPPGLAPRRAQALRAHHVESDKARRAREIVFPNIGYKQQLAALVFAETFAR